MGTNAGQFIRRIQVRTDRVSREIIPLYIRKVALDALARLIEKTPVDEGRARGNWQLAIGTIPRGEIRPLTGDVLIDEANKRLAEYEPGEIVNITNNVPYIIPLENGHSGQAPNGMVKVTIAELQAAGIAA